MKCAPYFDVIPLNSRAIFDLNFSLLLINALNSSSKIYVKEPWLSAYKLVTKNNAVFFGHL